METKVEDVYVIQSYRLTIYQVFDGKDCKSSKDLAQIAQKAKRDFHTL